MANFQLADVQKVSYALTELDADSNPASASPGDTITVVSSDTAMATVVADATPVSGSVASGFILGGSKLGTVNITATVTHTDGTSLSVTDTLDIVAGVASTISFGLGSPVNQP